MCLCKCVFVCVRVHFHMYTDMDSATSSACGCETTQRVSIGCNCAGEAQSCADIAADRVTVLEEQISNAAAELVAAKEAADTLLQEVRQKALKELETTRQDSLEQLNAANEALAAAHAAAEAAQAEASARCSSLLKALQEAESQKTELEAQVTRAAASLKAADDLKEAR